MRNAEAQTELGVVLEERIRPGRAAPLLVLRPGRGRQIAAVDRRATGGIGDDQAVAEQLGEQLEVGRFAATGARAGELEERLLHLHRAHARGRNLPAIQVRQGEEEIPVRALGLAQRRLRLHVDGLEPRLGFVARRANIHANAATGAILGRDLQGVVRALSIPAAARRST